MPGPVTAHNLREDRYLEHAHETFNALMPSASLMIEATYDRHATLAGGVEEVTLSTPGYKLRVSVPPYSPHVKERLVPVRALRDVFKNLAMSPLFQEEPLRDIRADEDIFALSDGSLWLSQRLIAGLTGIYDTAFEYQKPAMEMLVAPLIHGVKEAKAEPALQR